MSGSLSTRPSSVTLSRGPDQRDAGNYVDLHNPPWCFIEGDSFNPGPARAGRASGVRTIALNVFAKSGPGQAGAPWQVVNDILALFEDAEGRWDDPSRDFVYLNVRLRRAETVVSYPVKSGDVTIAGSGVNYLHLAVTADVQHTGISPEYALAIPGTITSGDTIWIEDVPGNTDADVRLVLRETGASHAIERFIIGRRAYPGLTAADWTPRLDLAEGADGLNVAAAGSYGGVTNRAVLPNGDPWQEIAVAAPSAGAAERGDYDLYLRAVDVPAVLPAPAITSATPALQTPVVGTKSTGTTSGTTGAVAATWSGTTPAGALLVAAMRTDTTHPHIAPADWIPAGYYVLTGAQTVSLWVIPASPARSGTETFTMSGGSGTTIAARLDLFSVTHVRPTDSLIDYAASGGSSVTIALDPDDGPVFVVQALAAPSNGDNQFSGYPASMTEQWDTTGLAVATGVIVYETTTGSSSSQPRSEIRQYRRGAGGSTLVSTIVGWFAIEGFTPGDSVPAATYTVRLVANDVTGNPSNAATASVVVPFDSNAITVVWTPPAAADFASYTLAVSDGVTVWSTLVDAGETSYTIHDLAALAEIAALPATSGATATPSLVRAVARFRDGTTDLDWTEAVRLAPTTNPQWIRVGPLTLPPTALARVTSPGDYDIVLEGQNGGGADGTLAFDTAYLVARCEPCVDVRAEEVPAGTGAEWIIETQRDGALGAEIGDLTTHVRIAPATTDGVLRLAPGRNALTPLTEGTGGAVLGRTFTASLVISPRFYLQAGRL